MAFDMRWKVRTLWVLVLVLMVSPVDAQDETKAAPKSKQDEYFELMQTFVDTFEQVDRNYVKDVDRRKLLEAALRGMIKELDPYSSYIPPEELARFNQQVDQQFGGIGIQVQPDPRTRRILVISPLPDTPAYKAGVRAGDIVTEVEGYDTENMPLSRAVELMKGPPGDTVSIKVRHLSATEDEEISMERAIINVKSVLGDKWGKEGNWDFLIDDEQKIGYVRLTQFGRKSAEELAEAIETLQGQGMKGLVLDLRFNPGGLLSQAVKISDLFVESGTIVSTEGKNTEKRTFEATKAGTLPDFPMAVLINRFSASASEILSACLQDHKRAVVIGERSWGKGSVQNVIELEAGASALKLTTAGYLRPSGKNIHRFPDSKVTDEWGVHPDDEVKFTRKELEDYDEYRRARDVLTEAAPPKSDFKDRQFEKALERVRAMLNGEGAGDDAEKSDDTKKVEKDKAAA
ncbi:MAG: carboxyl-terminal processing protease [Porticoccaceae bacterium]|jgi:carboxyl-terminal processing protease